MPYQSIFASSGGFNNIPVAKQGQAQAIISQFHPGQYAQVNAQIQAANAAKQAALPKAAPAPKSSLGNTLKNLAFHNPVEHAIGSAGRAVGRPIVDVATGQGGKAAHDVAQLSSDVTGGTVNQFARALRYVPQAIGREVQNKPITDIQQKAFGTTNQGDIAKKIIGSTLGTGSLLVGAPEARAATKGGALLKTATRLAGAGAVGGAATTITSNPRASVKDIAKSAGLGAALGGGGAVAGRLAGAGVQRIVGAPTRDALGTARNVAIQKATRAAQDTEIAGKASLEGATTQRIPVTDKSTPAAGKVNAPISDKNYLTQSAKLSRNYEKELAQTQAIRDPVTQQAMQRNIDSKYSALQENLDLKAGATSVDFKGKTTPATSEKSVTTSSTPKATSTETQPLSQTTLTADTAPKVSGSALKAEQRAVEKGLTADLGDKATYRGLSYKDEAGNAVKLLNENPDKARAVAMGTTAGDNSVHEVAVRRAVENRALQEGDVETLRRLASSSQHTNTSEAAQRLGAEGFHAERNSPVRAIREIQQARTAALGKKADTAVSDEVKAIRQKAVPVKRQDWHSFIKELQCK